MSPVNVFRERDVPFEGTTIHLYEGGAGAPLVLFHGSGTGAATLSNFRKVMEPLAVHFRVIAADLVGYGQSGLRPQEPYFDISMWLRQVQHVVNLADAPKVGVVGHSLSGALVLKAAAANPRIAAVATTATMGVAGARRSAGVKGWVLPATREELRRQIQGTVVDPNMIDEAEIDRRMTVLAQPGYKEYFARMYSGEQESFIDGSAVSDEELAAIRCPAVLFHGANDRSFSPEGTSLRLAKGMPQADVVVLSQCAHSVALEQPAKFLDVAVPFFRRALAG
jgi:2-hydroxymuconate-semialdehyde hydrolase